MKKFLCAVLAILTLMALVSCGDPMKKSEFGGKAIAIMPHYIGEGEDDPFYQFTEEDLTITIIYEDSLTAELTEGFQVKTTTEGGYFDIQVIWNGLDGNLLIPVGAEKYQQYKADLEARRQAAAESLAAEQVEVPTGSAE